MQKFFILQENLDGTKAAIKGQDARHIFRVLRLKPGHSLSMTNGQGMDFEGQILSAGPDLIQVLVTAQHPSTTESSLHLTVCCAMLKDPKMDQVIKDLTQVGIQEWIPFFCERSVPTPDPKRLKTRVQRWDTIARESIKQCKRSCLVSVFEPKKFTHILDLSKGFHQKIAFWEKSSHPLSHLAAPPSEHRAILLIGPEGGFTDLEIEAAESRGFKAYSLGPRILRAETAALCATTLVQHLLGDM